MRAKYDIGMLLRRTTSVLRSMGQVFITVVLVLADVVGSGPVGGASSSAFPPVVLPGRETKPYESPLGGAKEDR